MDRILDSIMQFIEKDDKADNDEREEIRYGLELIILKTMFWCLVTAVGIIMGYFWECVMYNLMFFMIRSYAGGYHAETRTRCLIQSVITVIIALIAIKISRDNIYAAVLLAFMTMGCGISIWILAPIDTENRQLDNKELKIFRNKSRIILIVEVVLGIAAYLIGFKTVACTAMAAIVTSGILVLTGWLKKK